jgi:hypothetical protein
MLRDHIGRQYQQEIHIGCARRRHRQDDADKKQSPDDPAENDLAEDDLAEVGRRIHCGSIIGNLGKNSTSSP